MHWRGKWQPTPVFWPGESQGRGAWWAAVYGVAQSRTQLKRLSSSSSTKKTPNRSQRSPPKQNRTKESRNLRTAKTLCPRWNETGKKCSTGKNTLQGALGRPPPKGNGAARWAPTRLRGRPARALLPSAGRTPARLSRRTAAAPRGPASSA